MDEDVVPSASSSSLLSSGDGMEEELAAAGREDDWSVRVVRRVVCWVWVLGAEPPD